MAKLPELSAGQRQRRSSLPAFLYNSASRGKKSSEPKSVAFKPIMETARVGTGEDVTGHGPHQSAHMDHPGFYPPGEGPGRTARPSLARRTSLQDSVIPEDEPLVLGSDPSIGPDQPAQSARRNSRCSRSSLEGSIPEETGSEEDDCAFYETEVVKPKKRRARRNRPIFNRLQSVPVEVHEGEPEYDLSQSIGGHSLDTHQDRGPRRRKSFLDVFTDIRRASTSLGMSGPLGRRSSIWDTMAGVDDPLEVVEEDSFEKDLARFRRSRSHISRRPSMPVELSSAWLPEADIEEERPPTIPEEGSQAEEGAVPETKPPEREEPPDGGWGWVIVFAVGLTFFISGGFGRSFTLTYQQLLHKFGESSTATSLVAAIFGTVKMFSSPMVSALTNRFSHKRVAVVGGLLSGMFMLVNAFPPSLLYLYVSYGVITAFATNMVTTPSLVIIGQYFRKKKGKAMGLAMLGVSFGGMAFPPLMEFLYREYGYTGTMIIVGGIMLHYCISGMLFRPLVSKVKFPADEGKDSDSIKPETKSEDATRNGDCAGDVLIKIEDTSDTKPRSRTPLSLLRKKLFKKRLKKKVNHNNNGDVTSRRGCCGRVVRYIMSLLELQLLKDVRFVMFALLMVGTFICLSVTTNFIAGLAVEAGIAESQVALMISVSAFCDMPSRLLSGLLFDMKIIRENHRPTLFPVMGLLTGLFTFSLGLCRSYSALFGFWIAYTFCASAYHTQHITVLSDIVGSRQLTGALGLSRMFMGVGLIIGPTLGGFMKDTRGSYRVSYYVGGSALIVTSLAFEILNLVLFRRQKSEEEEEEEEAPTEEIKIPLHYNPDRINIPQNADEIKLLDEKLNQCETESESDDRSDRSLPGEREPVTGTGAGGTGGAGETGETGAGETRAGETGGGETRETGGGGTRETGGGGTRETGDGETGGTRGGGKGETGGGTESTGAGTESIGAGGTRETGAREIRETEGGTESIGAGGTGDTHTGAGGTEAGEVGDTESEAGEDIALIESQQSADDPKRRRRKSVRDIYEEENEPGNCADKGYN